MSIDSDIRSRIALSTGQLLFLGFDPEQYLSSRRKLTTLGVTWWPSDFKVGSFEKGEYGISGLTITLGDIDFSWAHRFKEAATSRLPAGIACRWYLLYGNGADWESELVFSGELDSPRISARNMVQVTASVATAHTALSPRVPFESPYSLASGEERVFNNTMYRVE